MKRFKVPMNEVDPAAYFGGKLGVYEYGYQSKRAHVIRFYIALVRKLLPSALIGHAKKALDIGCAYGFGVEALLRLGYDAYGCDIAKFAVDKANQLHNWSRCFVLDVCKDSLPFHRYSLVMMVDTIEHLKDPLSALRNIYQALEPGGTLIVVTNNAFSPLILRDRDITHISVYSPFRWYRVFRSLMSLFCAHI